MWFAEQAFSGLLMRELIRRKLAEAEQSGNEIRLGMLRLVNLAIQDRDKVARQSGKAELVSNEIVRNLLITMIKQRKKSSIGFEQHGQLDLAERERIEISVLEELLPRKLAANEVEQVIAKTVRDMRACGIRDKGKVMQALKAKYPGRMDFREVNELVIRKLTEQPSSSTGC